MTPLRCCVLLAPWLASLVAGCADDAADPLASSGTNSGGSAGGSAGSGVAAGASGSAGSGTGGAVSGAGGSVAGGGAAADPALHLALFNVVNQAIEQGLDPLPVKLQRVELPPRFTLAAQVPEDIHSVRFSVDGADALDTSPGYRFTEDADGAATPWAAKLGSHTVKVQSFTTPDGSGPPAHELEVTFALSADGMDAAFEPTNQALNDAWVEQHLDEVMEAKMFTGSVGSLPYRLYTPEHYADTVKYPVLIYLHGRGQRGTDNLDTYTSQLFHGPQSIVSPNQQQQFPSFVVVPQCGDVPSNQEWAHWIGNSEAQPFAGLGSDGSYMQHADPWPSALLVKELVESMATTLSIEPGRVYLTGESMGGFGTWDFTTRWPELFAVGVPMAGYSDRSKVARILDIPFWVFHGDADQSNPVAGSRAMVKAINDAGGSAKYTEYPGVDHGGTFDKAWTEETELLPFIFAQRKQP